MRRALAVVTLAVFSLLPAEPVHAERVFEARTTSQINLPLAAREFVTVMQLAVPTGRWVIHAKTQAVNFGAFDVVRCVLAKGAVVIDRSATNVGVLDEQPVTAMLVNQAVTRTTGTTMIRVRCSHDETAGAPSIDPGSSLIVEEVVP
jgi:hypothetical protein